MSHIDRYGLPISTRSEAAAAAYRDGVDRSLSAWPGAGAAFDAALEADDAFALARVARARVLLLGGQPAAARSEIALARAFFARDGTERERSHVEVFAHGIEGRPAQAMGAALAHLDAWPRDAYVLSLLTGAFGLLAFSGMAGHDQARVDLCERMRRHYGEDWWFLTHLGWSHTENGNVRVGRGLSERALELRWENASGVHGLLHAMFEDGSGDDADALVTRWLPGYDRAGVLHGHLCWHQALVMLERGDAARALAIYTEHVRPGVNSGMPINRVSDAAGLLWRMNTDGHAVPAHLWDEAANYAAEVYPQASFPFADLHMALLEAGTGRVAALDSRIASLQRQVDAGTLAAGPVVPALCRALRAFADGAERQCAQILEPLLGEVVRVGGSHAQREIVEDTLLVAWMRCGEAGKARDLLEARLSRRPSTRDRRWLAAGA